MRSDRDGDIGAPDVLRSYHQARKADVLARTLAVDALNRSLLADFLPGAGAARSRAAPVGQQSLAAPPAHAGRHDARRRPAAPDALRCARLRA